MNQSTLFLENKAYSPLGVMDGGILPKQKIRYHPKHSRFSNELTEILSSPISNIIKDWREQELERSEVANKRKIFLMKELNNIKDRREQIYNKIKQKPNPKNN